ncbi:MAG: ureidoglycolate lyase [Actinobacteria bacterium]|nr:ureidoglycolate lyase [Actinomycetota bacterium]
MVDPAPQPETIVLRAGRLSHEAFAPFGHLPADEGTEHDRADAEFLWNDGHVNFISHRADEVSIGDTGLLCELLNRHDTHTQTLMPMDATCIVVVAPAELDLSRRDHIDAARAFVVEPYECIHLDRGTWHWGPYPIDAPSVRVFNLQGTGYARDNGVASLTTDLGVVIEVDATSTRPGATYEIA